MRKQPGQRFWVLFREIAIETGDTLAAHEKWEELTPDTKNYLARIEARLMAGGWGLSPEYAGIRERLHNRLQNFFNKQVTPSVLEGLQGAFLAAVREAADVAGLPQEVLHIKLKVAQKEDTVSLLVVDVSEELEEVLFRAGLGAGSADG
jgi:hypothetical protein